MENYDGAGCTPDNCESCTGCCGSIEKISLRVEWRHKGDNVNAEEIEKSIFKIASELAVSGVELIYINNTFGNDIDEGTSQFYINEKPLEDLTPISPDGVISQEILRKGIFQALLQNI